MGQLEQFYTVSKNLCTSSIPTKLLYRSAVASHNNKFHCLSAQNSSQDYFACRSIKIFLAVRNHSICHPKMNPYRLKRKSVILGY